MTASLCTITGQILGAATPPDGGGPASSAQAQSVLWQVTAELKAYGLPILNDGANPITQPFVGTAVRTPITISGFLVGFRDGVTYTIQVPFIDELFAGNTPLTPPYQAYYLIRESYYTNQFLANPGQTDQYEIKRKCRPLSSGGSVQAISGILV